MEFVSTTELLSNVSHRPISDLCLSAEAVRVGQMLYVLKSSRAIPIEIKTDSVISKPLKRSIDVGQKSFRDLDTLRQQFTSTPGMKKLNQYTMMAAIPPDEKVLKFNTAKERDNMNAVTSCPKRSSTLKTKRNE